MKYIELKNKHQEEVNDFPMIFAFSEKQLFEGMEKLGLKPNEINQLSPFGYGGYVRKTDRKKLDDMFKRHENERTKAIAEDLTGEGYIYEMFRYELANHEYGYTRDLNDTLDALDFTIKDIKSDARLLHGLKKAVNDIEME